MCRLLGLASIASSRSLWYKSEKLLILVCSVLCWYIAFISGPVLVMILKKENAVADWRAIIGPTDARKAKITHPHRFFEFSLFGSVYNLYIFSLPHFIPCNIEFPCHHSLLDYFWYFQHQSNVWLECRKELCSWFRLSWISSKGNFLFLWRDIHRSVVLSFLLRPTMGWISILPFLAAPS